MLKQKRKINIQKSKKRLWTHLNIAFEHRERKVWYKEQMTNLGGTNVMVNTVQLAKCSHCSISKLMCDLLTMLFSRDELSGSSLTGKVSNTHINKGATPKNKLDPLKVEAIKSYVMLKFRCNKCRDYYIQDNKTEIQQPVEDT